MTWGKNNCLRMTEDFRDERFNRFKNNLYKYPEVEKLVNTPLRDMLGTPYEKYVNFVLPKDMDLYMNNTLLDIMQQTDMVKQRGYMGNVFEVLYSYNEEDAPIGWFSFYYEGSTVNNIKMFSFGTNDFTFMRDVKKKFFEILDRFDIVTWGSNQTNPFIKHYIRAIMEYNGSCYLDDNGAIMYTINKYEPNKDFSNLEEIFDREMLRKAGYYKKMAEMK